ncbi:MAG: hypothetical protein LUH10_05205 [Tannerellaceae bacterium]|nr:hypothetical protein [Tannerellaceae bacterium]
MTQKYLIHSNEFHLIDPAEIQAATEELVEKLNMAAGSTEGFDLYKVMQSYFTHLERRHEINKLLDIEQEAEYYAEQVQLGND